MKIYAVIVTYGDRFHFLKQVIEACFREDVNKVIVIDNNSEIKSKVKLKELEKKLSDKLKVIYLVENTGSAGGVKRGLEEAYKSDCDFMWVFDDDNVAKKGSLKALLNFWDYKALNNSNTMLISLRADRRQYYKSIEQNNPEILTGKKNSFMTFDFATYILRNFSKVRIIEKYHKNYGEVHQAPYGGMFLHRNLIDKIGYPNEDYFVYTDDTEYSYSVIKNGGKIYAVFDSLLEDIDVSWHDVEMKKGLFSSPILDTL